jgi:hypothetical protein
MLSGQATATPVAATALKCGAKGDGSSSAGYNFEMEEYEKDVRRKIGGVKKVQKRI